MTTTLEQEEEIIHRSHVRIRRIYYVRDNLNRIVHAIDENTITQTGGIPHTTRVTYNKPLKIKR